MNCRLLLVAWVVVLAVTTVAQAQSLEEPAATLGAPIAKSPKPPAALGAPVATPVAQSPLPLPRGQDATEAVPQPPPAPPAVQIPMPPAMQIPMPPAPPIVTDGLAAPARGATSPAWVRADYLLWWARGGPTGGPLVTTGATGGALDKPDTRVLLGDRPMGYGPFSGLRIAGGLSVADGLTVEGDFLYLGQRTFGFSAGSNAAGEPIVARPVINAQTGAQSSYVDSLPGALAGTVSVESHLRIDGYEFNLARSMASTGGVRFDVLGGFRALDMSESLSMRDRLTALAPGFLTFNGVPLPAGSEESDFDTFRTSNHFYGGQLGGRLGWLIGRLSASAWAKVALGVTQQLVDINGGSERFVVGTSPLSAPGGILAQPSNIGHYYRSTFSVVPETGLELGYQITPQLRATLGYTLLYWTHVARPGNQTDRTVNPAQVPTDPAFGIGGGPARPSLPAIRDSEFWVQGVNFGLLFAF
jgi:hypothetical protein